MNNTYEPCGEQVNQPTPPEHERDTDCQNPKDEETCADYTDARAE